MRKKNTSKMYMRDVTEWVMVIEKKETHNYYVVIKKIIKINQPFKIGNTVLIADGYYVVEITPLDCFYNVRVFLDDDANVIGYYFDISKENGITDNIPYYDDLYLDVIYSPDKDNPIRIEDMDELLEAFYEGKITSDEYNFACETCNNLVNELKNRHNMFIDIDVTKIIHKYFK